MPKKLFLLENLNISTIARTASDKSLDFDVTVFFNELCRFFKEDLFYNLPVQCELKPICLSKDKEESMAYLVQFQIGKMTLEKYQESNECAVDILPEEVFFIGFNINVSNKIIQFCTNLRASNFRHIMYSCPHFIQNFYEHLVPTEYFIYKKDYSKKVLEAYETLKHENVGKRSNSMLYHEAILNTNAIFEFAQSEGESLTTYKIKFKAHAFYFQEKAIDASLRAYYSENSNKAPSLTEFMQPVSTESCIYTASHIAGQLRKIKELQTNSSSKRLALYVGARSGINLKSIEKAFPDLILFAVEPTFYDHDLETYEGNPEHLFWMKAEDLLAH